VTRAEWIEAALIAVFALVSTLAWPYLPAETNVSRLILGSAVLLLAQSLLRDVTGLLRGRVTKQVTPAHTANCMCLESAIGAVGVVIGLGAAGLASFGTASLGRVGFSLSAIGTLAFGLAIKDWVIVWNPWGFRREKDHLNLIVRWKR
jgi:hypothetical protein